MEREKIANVVRQISDDNVGMGVVLISLNSGENFVVQTHAVDTRDSNLLKFWGVHMSMHEKPLTYLYILVKDVREATSEEIDQA